MISTEQRSRFAYKRPRTPHYDDPAAVGRRVLEARNLAGLSQSELSFPGCTSAYISRIEKGERVPSLQVLRQIGKRTGVSEDVLAFGRERLAPDVARQLRAAEAAEASGDAEARSSAYNSLARAARAAARDLEAEHSRRRQNLSG